MPLNRLYQENEKAFYWWIILPLQSLLLTVTTAPMYGFSALIEPINIAMGAENPTNGLPGALSGSLILLASGASAVFFGKLMKVFGGRTPFFVFLNVIMCVGFVLGALACHWQLYWLLIVGFALPVGFACANIFMICVSFLLPWGRKYGHAGLSTGVYGMLFGLWGALYSFVGPILYEKVGVFWLLVGTGVVVAVIELLALIFMVNPAAAAPQANAPSAPSDPVLGIRQIMGIPTYWVFFVFLLLFLAPGFGFKIIVQALSKDVFDATTMTASIMAVAFLATYGISRLVFGILSDKISLKPMYFLFGLVQAAALLIAAITLPNLQGVAFFTVLMCIVGGMFAAGKCLFTLVCVHIYGPVNFATGITMVLPAYGLAGFIGPITLTYAMRSSDVVETTSWWLYAASAVLLICVVLFHVLRRVDYAKIASNTSQGLHLGFKSTTEFDRF